MLSLRVASISDREWGQRNSDANLRLSPEFSWAINVGQRRRLAQLQ